MSEVLGVFGLGRSGLGVARAEIGRGRPVHVFDEGDPATISKQEVVEEARRLDIPVTFLWNGDLPPEVRVLVVNPAVRRTHPFLLKALEAGVQVISEIEYAYRISKAPIVALTGTNGKSTTTVMTYQCLRQCGKDAVLCGNIFGSGYPEVPLTEAAAASNPNQVLVAEISSFQLEWIVDFHPIVAGITNIWPDHLDRYDSFADYAATKHRLFMNLAPGDYVVVKANDPVVKAPGTGLGEYVPRGRRRSGPAEQPKGLPTVLTFGAMGQHGQVEERELALLDKRVSIERLPFHEPHNYQNAAMAGLLAWAALRHLGETGEGMPDCIVEGLLGFKGLAHRMEFLGRRDGIRVYNNSMCTNPDAVMKSVQSVKDPTHILMGGVNKNVDFRPLRHYLANHRHHVYLYGADASALNEMMGGTWPVYSSMQDAFWASTKVARSGDVIMLAPGCASTDSFRDFRERGDVFRVMAKEWLNNESELTIR